MEYYFQISMIYGIIITPDSINILILYNNISSSIINNEFNVVVFIELSRNFDT